MRLNVNDTEDTEVNVNGGGVSPHHVLEMQTSGLSHVEYESSEAGGSGNIYQPPPASASPHPAHSPSYRSQVEKGSSGWTPEHAENT